MTISTHPKKVLAWATNPVCALYRLKAPLTALQQEGSIDLHLTDRFDATTYQQLLSWADVFIIQRARVDETLRKVISDAKAAGVEVVYEIDDDLLALERCPSLSGLMPAKDLTAIEEGLRLADVIHVSTPTLSERYAHYGEVRVLPNGFPVSPPPLPPQSDDERAIRIFYGAGRWHQPDWAHIVEALDSRLRQIVDTEALTIEVLLMGATWQTPPDSSHLRYHVVGPQPWTEYLKTMGSSDIALMPLEPNAHTDAKSAIKFFESAAMGAAAVALGGIYQQTIQHGKTGLLADTPETFAELVATLCGDKLQRQSLRTEAYRWLCETNLLTHHLPRWREALR